MAAALLLALGPLLLPNATGRVRTAGGRASRGHRERSGKRREETLGGIRVALGAGGQRVRRAPGLEAGAAGVAAEVIERHQRPPAAAIAPRTVSTCAAADAWEFMFDTRQLCFVFDIPDSM
jgi:hypothetical protein